MPQILMGSARRSGVGIARDWRWTDRIAPNARFIAGELALWAAVYGAYLGLRAIAIAGESRAFRNAHHVIGAERALGLSQEAAAQRALHPAEPLLSTYYMLGFGPLILTALVWLAWRRRDVYRSLRTALLCSIGMAAVVHLTFPVAPPRMIAGLGISDWVGLSGGHDSGSFAGIRFNPYAAMPGSTWMGPCPLASPPGALPRSVEAGPPPPPHHHRRSPSPPPPPTTPSSSTRSGGGAVRFPASASRPRRPFRPPARCEPPPAPAGPVFGPRGLGGPGSSPGRG